MEKREPTLLERIRLLEQLSKQFRHYSFHLVGVQIPPEPLKNFGGKVLEDYFTGESKKYGLDGKLPTLQNYCLLFAIKRRRYEAENVDGAMNQEDIKYAVMTIRSVQTKLSEAVGTLSSLASEGKYSHECAEHILGLVRALNTFLSKESTPWTKEAKDRNAVEDAKRTADFLKALGYKF